MNKQHLDRYDYYINRELSWLRFNERVLQEAEDTSNPLLERLKFMAIFSSNLDEFFMVRVAGLKDQVKAGFNKPDNKSGFTPKQQLKKISSLSHQLVDQQYRHYSEVLIGQLEKENIHFLPISKWKKSEIKHLEQYFHHYILPVLTPMAIDAYRPFPMLSNKSLNLAVVLEGKHDEGAEKLAIVQVPSLLTRAVPIKREGIEAFALLEDIITYFIGSLFSGNKVLSVSPFRITRNADLTIHEEGARDLLREIEKELKKRKWGAAVRLEIISHAMERKVLSFLSSVLEIEEGDIFESEGPLDFTFLFGLYNQLKDHHEHLIDESFVPQPSEEIMEHESLFDAIMERDIFFHHPYHSFQPIVDLIAYASQDPDVLAIKQTLYRVSGDSPIIAALVQAAENGKQVTVLVELKARFDEEKNIQWAKKLEKAGVHVIYGITGLKTHSKITLIIRHQENGIQRYVHLGTGNYNDSTAKLYTDMGILTAKSSFGEDATNFFNHLSGFSEKPKWYKISTSPFEMRETFMTLIDKEIAVHNERGNGRIIAKMNSLTDKPIIMKLYEASMQGVRIDLIVRGICCLRPGLKGISEHITVRSIIDRFLEHSRIFYFHHDGDERIFLSSADWMTRNMEKRIEILFPVSEPAIKQKVKQVLDYGLQDNVKARIQMADGTYTYVSRRKKRKTIQKSGSTLPGSRPIRRK
ncbi:Polyphosphate kinase [[Bacillus] selenitireducens MLS10]|uniref:Polyphosphate kinase n=1 Tax=Bacillus selenitireducens (strain ATCC 700615 / DSM 15326 / MLS10) TaxID=439292 RepID=D6XW82_BACIE|nr:RNA degradosome polyphosphate kinase [Salisediminibacterium selenitireducens]ADH99836.1 Polyphosphate kinase [[Bacillus] selenitireducens MLS10]